MQASRLQFTSVPTPSPHFFPEEASVLQITGVEASLQQLTGVFLIEIQLPSGKASHLQFMKGTAVNEAAMKHASIINEAALKHASIEDTAFAASLSWSYSSSSSPS